MDLPPQPSCVGALGKTGAGGVLCLGSRAGFGNLTSALGPAYRIAEFPR